MQTIGIFGGTFDPVHIGHLRIALEMQQRLDFDQMRLLPCHIPPHRQALSASSEQRVAMVRLAVAGCSQLSVDERELHREKASYTVDTLLDMRREMGQNVSLCLSVGMDSLVNLNTWHRWQDILELAHIVVAARPGWQLPEHGPVAEQWRQRTTVASDLSRYPGGKIVIETFTLLPISSTQIRSQIGAGESPQFLLPDAVWHYINEHQLYT